MSGFLGGLVTVTTPDRRRGPEVPIESDPRISTLRPAWLADDQAWRDQLQALDLEQDIRWLERQWDLAGGRPADHDRSWIKMERVWG